MSGARPSRAPETAEVVSPAPERMVSKTPESTDTREEETMLLSSSIAPVRAPTSSMLSAAVADSGDRERTEKRYREAVAKLQKSIKLPRESWEVFAIRDFKDFADVTNPIPQLQQDIKKTLDAREKSIKDPGVWSTTKRITEKIFTAISPLAKNVLVVAKEGSNVAPIADRH
jgi:hypothetical protein